MLQFVARLVVLSVAFEILLRLTVFLLITLMAWAIRSFRSVYPHWFPDLMMSSWGAPSLLYPGVIAIATANYTSSAGVEHHWFYAACGFIFTFIFSAYSTVEEARVLAKSVMQDTDDAAFFAGCVVWMGIPACLGLLTFPIFYHWPGILRMIPDAGTLHNSLNAAIRAADWLARFWVVRILAVAFTIGIVGGLGRVASTWKMVLGIDQ